MTGEPDKTVLLVKLDMMLNTFNELDRLDQQIVTITASTAVKNPATLLKSQWNLAK